MSMTLNQEPLAPFHFLFTCPHCRSVRQAPEQYLGQAGQCTTCGGEITLAPLALPEVSTMPRPRAWYRERTLHFEYCRDHYERARAAYPPVANDTYWQQQIRDAANCPDRVTQVAQFERLVAEGIPWPVAFEYLVHHYVKEHDYARAYYFCAVYFHSDRWRNPQCASDSYKLLKYMRKLEKKLYPNFEG